MSDIAILTIMDVAAIAAALVAAWFWYQAGERPPRRVTKDEELDAADINRIVVALQRAALASAASATMIALNILATWFVAG